MAVTASRLLQALRPRHYFWEVQENELRILKLHELGTALLRDFFNPESGEH
jgi:hypothetical protein